jgi:hypothetical protein
MAGLVLSVLRKLEIRSHPTRLVLIVTVRSAGRVGNCLVLDNRVESVIRCRDLRYRRAGSWLGVGGRKNYLTLPQGKELFDSYHLTVISYQFEFGAPSDN